MGALQADTGADLPLDQTTCGTVAIELTPSTGTTGDEIVVSVNISGNQCEVSSFGFDLYFDTGMFAYVGLESQNTLCADWSMLDGNEIDPGQVRIGGYSGTGTNVSVGQNGCLVKVKLEVSGNCGTYPDGQQSPITMQSYFDDLTGYLPHSVDDTFTLMCCGGGISQPGDLQGAWGDLVYIPVHISSNTGQICSFQFDFSFDPAVLEFQDAARSNAISNWSDLTWSPVESGKVRVSGSVGSGSCVAPGSDTDLVVLQVMVQCVGYGSDTDIPIQIENYANGISDLCPRSIEENFLYKTCPRLGDVSGDGTVTPGDAQTAFEIYLGKLVPNDLQLTTADANCGCPCDGLQHTAANNCITPGDAQWIFEHFLQKRNLPLCSADYTCPETAPASVDRSFDLPDFQPDARRVLYALPGLGRAGELVSIPILLNAPQGVSTFCFDMIYPQALLEYRGVLASPLTNNFDILTGEEQVPGVVRIEGDADQGIASKETGSLCVALFEVKEGMTGTAAIELSSLNGDLFEAEVESTMFKALPPENGMGSVVLGKARERDGLLFVPVKVTGALGLDAFGLELSFPLDRLEFVGVERTEMSAEFVAVDALQTAEGLLRVGGFSAGPNLDFAEGTLVRLVFTVKECGADIQILRVWDDLADFTVIK